MRSQKVDMPSSEAFKIAAAGVGSIGFMNISLNLNSVGFYQITKLAIVPCTLVAQASVAQQREQFGRRRPRLASCSHRTFLCSVPSA